MQENEFEKQVKNVMEELRYSPSAPVWENIKRKITKKKRRVLPFFFLIMTITIVSGYFIYSNNKQYNQNTNKNQSAVNNSKSKTGLYNDAKKENANQKKSISQAQPGKHSTIKGNTNKLRPVNKFFKKDEPSFLYQPLIKKNYTETFSDTLHDKSAVANTKLPEQKNDISFKKQDGSVNIFKDSILKNNIDTSAKNDVEPVKNDPATQQKKQNRNIKWQWGISAMYGRSTITNSLFSSGFNKSLSIPNANNPGNVFNSPAALKHPYNTATAYNFGITIKRKISRQSYLNTGLNFVHLSSKSNTARNLDSSLIPIVADVQNSNYVNGYYRLGSAKTYTNTFNFIELPITFQSDIVHIKKFSFSYNAGLSVMQLLSSKSLIYDSHTNNFFEDNSLLRRTQFQLITGLNLQLNTKNNGAVLLSPQFKYSFSTFLKNNNYNRLHFLNYGLQAAWLFNKK